MEGCSNSAVAVRLAGSDGAVAKHIANIFTKLELAPAEDTNRRVLAVSAHLNGGSERTWASGR